MVARVTVGADPDAAGVEAGVRDQPWVFGADEPSVRFAGDGAMGVGSAEVRDPVDVFVHEAVAVIGHDLLAPLPLSIRVSEPRSIVRVSPTVRAEEHHGWFGSAPLVLPVTDHAVAREACCLML